MSNPPTVVLIPGSWHQPTYYDPIIKPLQGQYGLKCVAVSLPSTTGNPVATFKDDLDAARESISRETIQGRNVVVLAHSYGGMVGNSAIKGFAKPRVPSTGRSTGQPQTLAGHVIGLVLLASGFTLAGLSFMDPCFGHPPPFWHVNDVSGFAELVANPRELFYHDVPAEEVEFWVSQLTPQSLKSLF
ncbi:alpha/beta fold hydrolase [Aspergillus lucknowensis]|uniref:AB hydrolase-1 domain-containing protein n=1 Tax=Aspergillus lucknowensis TaxID=176173 RepID=A0ABR4M631_9EURO